MNSAEYVADLIAKQKAEGVDPMRICWNAAKACVGWPYVYGAVGEECRPKKRAQYGTKFYPKGHETIVTKCKAISMDAEGKTCSVTGSCTGCKWDIPVRMTDCRGFTRKLLNMVYNWTLMGGTVGGQWKDEKNWKAKGEIGTMPKDTLCCLFVYKNNNWQHTGFGWNNETVESSSGVQYFSKRNAKWTHWAVPACIGAEVNPSEPAQKPASDGKATLKRGSKGAAVIELQTMLTKLGYGVGPCGIDGDFGRATQAAVEQFQLEHKLTVDGICGPKTYAKLEEAYAKLQNPEPVVVNYTVVIRGLSLDEADQLVMKYPGATASAEGSVAK